MAMFSYDHLTFRYEPFPIGIAKPVLRDEHYRRLLESYPPLELFKNIPKLGNKYSLSERFNPEQYRQFIRYQPDWRALHEWIKSEDFIQGVMDTLLQHHIDLGYRPPGERDWLKRLKDIRRGRGLKTRFEFSMLPADGGHIMPHTDAPAKIVTLIVSMVGEGEWQPEFGGGTDVNWPRDPARSYNQLNRQAGFDEVDTLHTYEFTPNQAVIFIKTFNSWHSVRPMGGAGSDAMRRTLTINIEREG